MRYRLLVSVSATILLSLCNCAMDSEVIFREGGGDMNASRHRGAVVKADLVATQLWPERTEIVGDWSVVYRDSSDILDPMTIAMSELRTWKAASKADEHFMCLDSNWLAFKCTNQRIQSVDRIDCVDIELHDDSLSVRMRVLQPRDHSGRFTPAQADIVLMLELPHPGVRSVEAAIEFQEVIDGQPSNKVSLLTSPEIVLLRP
jgi:hypothetical protein